MPKRLSSTQGWLEYALNLARKKRTEQAQQALKKLALRSLSAEDLRLMAQVHNRCDNLEEAERCWLSVQQRGAMEAGDYYMLGSLQARMSKLEDAASSYEREIALGATYFLDSAKLRLADLLLRMNRPSAARNLLLSLREGASDYVDGVGLCTREAMISVVDERLKNGEGGAI